MERDPFCPYETVEKRGDRAKSEPVLKGVKEEFRASVTVFLPSIQLRSERKPDESDSEARLTSSSHVRETPSWNPPLE